MKSKSKKMADLKKRDKRLWSKKIFQGVGGFLKILRNIQSGSQQMLTSNYKVGGWGEKMPKTCLRNI